MADASGQDFSETFFEQLKCYICENRLNAGKHHWYRCTQGHMVCQDCKVVKEKKNCSCQNPVVAEHCKLIEALLNVEKMQFKCENLVRGCLEKLDKESMTSHQGECIYRVIKCTGFVGSCESKVPFHELLGHLEGKGKTLSSTFGTRFESFFRNCSQSREKVEFPLKKFVVSKTIFFNICIILDDSFHHWIVLYGSANEAKNYSYTLEYLDETDETKCSFTGKMISIDETFDSIIENGNCFGINRKLFDKKFIIPEDDNKFKFFVTIRNLKEEVKDENVESGVSDVDE